MASAAKNRFNKTDGKPKRTVVSQDKKPITTKGRMLDNKLRKKER
jgi:hypothetical protein